MARVNIYVPDNLKARMDGAGETINWSEVVRPVIQSAIADFEHRKDRNMSTAIARLRASKQEHVQSEQTFGKEAGRKWAEDRASYEDLVRLSSSELDEWENPSDLLDDAVNPSDDLTAEEVIEFTHGETQATKEYVAAFIEGAKEFFAEVRDKI
jgi:hypothetical protein